MDLIINELCFGLLMDLLSFMSYKYVPLSFFITIFRTLWMKREGRDGNIIKENCRGIRVEGNLWGYLRRLENTSKHLVHLWFIYRELVRLRNTWVENGACSY